MGIDVIRAFFDGYSLDNRRLLRREINMCNYEMEKNLLLNGVTLKPCDFETEEVVERKGTRKLTNRGQRRKATAKANRRKAEIADLRKRRKVKAERDGEMWYLGRTLENGMMMEAEIHDSKLWKPMNNKARTSCVKTSL